MSDKERGWQPAKTLLEGIQCTGATVDQQQWLATQAERGGGTPHSQFATTAGTMKTE